MQYMGKYTVIIEKDDKGWLIAEVLGLPGCHTQAKNKEELLKRIKEAIQAYVQDSEPEHSFEFIGVEHVEVQIKKLPHLTGKELGGVVEKFGFILHNTTGSHRVYRHSDGRNTVNPCHAGEEIGPGLLNKIIKKDLQITREIFLSKC